MEEVFLTHVTASTLCVCRNKKKPNFSYVFWWWYFHLHVSAGHLTTYRMTFLLQEYSVKKCVSSLHNIEICIIIIIIIIIIIGKNFVYDCNMKWHKTK